MLLVGALFMVAGSWSYLDAQSEDIDGVSSTRVISEFQLGSTEGLGFKLPHLALGARIEKSVTSKFEIDAEMIYSPDHKFGFDAGHQITAETGSIYWTTHRIGVSGGYEHNWLATPEYRKSVTIPSFGVVLRGFNDYPWRVYFNWLIPSGRYDPKTGIEPSRLTGPEFMYEFQLHEHLRFGLLLGIYHGLEQGNPACDGNAPNPQHLPPCPRTAYTTGQSSLIFRFTRKQSTWGTY
jgi:hypothetical protein